MALTVWFTKETAANCCAAVGSVEQSGVTICMPEPMVPMDKGHVMAPAGEMVGSENEAEVPVDPLMPGMVPVFPAFPDGDGEVMGGMSLTGGVACIPLFPEGLVMPGIVEVSFTRVPITGMLELPLPLLIFGMVDDDCPLADCMLGIEGVDVARGEPERAMLIAGFPTS